MASLPALPPDYLFSVAVVIMLSLALSLALTMLARRIGPLLRLTSKPGGRRKHGMEISQFGALPLWGAFTLTALLAQRLVNDFSMSLDPNEIIRLTGLLAGGTFLFLFGIVDDRFELPGLPQYIAQLIAAAIGVSFLIFIEKFNNPLTGVTTDDFPYVVTVTISLFWLGLMMNTLNWLDGVDGLAGGVALIASILLFIHTVREGQLSVSLLPLALIGALIGFMRFNWYPASIYMGSGAVFLGYTIGALSVIGGAKMATILLVMGLPLLDVAWQVGRRISNGQNPLVGDRGHMHFRLIDKNVDPRLICAGYYLFCAAFGALALILPSESQRIFKLVAIVIMMVLVLIGFALVARLRPNGRES